MADPRPKPPARVLAAISAGGFLGALARYGLGVARPLGPSGFPWSTWTVNVTGCLPALTYLAVTLIGALLAVWAGTAATEAVFRR